MNYTNEAKERWGKTDAYREHATKTKNYSEDKWQDLGNEMDALMAAFASCMNTGTAPHADEAQQLVKKLQSHITANYYTCTTEILAGLGQMYVTDERFKRNIDKHSDGTAAFVSKAIGFYTDPVTE